jgi:type 1 glutamine amidotransferase
LYFWIVKQNINQNHSIMKKLTSIICLLLIMVFSSMAQVKKINVLVFSKTMGFRHNSISAGLKMMSDLAQQRKWVLTATENADLFTPDFLNIFDVVVFLNPTGDVLNELQQKNFEAFMATGKGFVGIHAAADCEYDWAWYGQLNGAFFKTHPPAQIGTVVFENTDHPTMVPFKGMKDYRTFDEWYSFKENPRSGVNVLAHLDETSLNEAALKDEKWKMGDHPLIWYEETGNSRSFYTVFGHTPEAFQDPKIKEHIGCAVDWVAKR